MWFDQCQECLVWHQFEIVDQTFFKCKNCGQRYWITEKKHD